MAKILKNVIRKGNVQMQPNKRASLRRLNVGSSLVIKNCSVGQYFSWRGSITMLKKVSDLDFKLMVSKDKMTIIRLPDRVKENSIDNNMV